MLIAVNGTLRLSTPVGDTTPPVLSLPTASGLTSSTVAWGVTSNESDGTVFAALRLSSVAQLDVGEIEAGTGNAIAIGNDATMTADGANGGTLSPSLAETEYVVDIFARDAAGNESDVVSSAPFTTPAAGATLPATLQTSATLRGATLNFNQILVGTGIDGRPVLDSTNGITVTSKSPASILNVNGRRINTLNKNPFSKNAEQGIDERIGEPNSAGAGQIAYNDALDLSPERADRADLVIPAGEKGTLVVHIPRSPDSDPSWAMTVDSVEIAYMPIADTRNQMFSPGASLYAADVYDDRLFTLGDIDYSVLRSLAPPAGAPTLAALLAELPDALQLYGFVGEDLRRIIGGYHANGIAVSGYSGDYGQYEAAFWMMMHSNVSNAAKEAAVIKGISRGLTVDASYQAGQSYSAGAGQFHGYHTAHFNAAILLGDSAMLQRARAVRSNMRDHPAWAVASDEGLGVSFPGPTGQQARYRHTFFQQDLLKPFWSEKFRGSQPTARYLTLSLPVGVVEAFSILLMQNSASLGMDGVEAFLDGADDQTNDYAAALQIYSRLNTWKNTERGFQLFTPVAINMRDIIAAWSGNIANYGTWTGVPDVIDAYEAADQNFFTPVDGGVAWDITGYDFGGNLPITDIEVGISYDGFGFITTNGHGDTGQITGLMRGGDIYCRLAKVNSAGAGRPSVNFDFSDEPFAFSEGPRNIVQATGSEASAEPVNTVPPQVSVQQYTAWGGPSWEALVGALDANQVVLAAAVMGWTGFPFPTFNRQWEQRDDGGAETDITIANGFDQDANGAIFTRRAENSSPPGVVREVRARITPDNGVGSPPPVYTPWVIIPERTVNPAGTIINNEFKQSAAIDLEELFASVTGFNGTWVHEPATNYGIGDNVGSYMFDKSGGNPTGRIPFALQPNTAYLMDYQRLMIGTTNAQRGDFVFEIQEQVSGPVLYSVATPGADVLASPFTTEDGKSILLDEQFNVPFTTSAETDVRAKANWSDGTGGGGAADKHGFSFLWIREA